ncbi:MAG: hypothetical protein ABF242_03105 [Flavobacteriales bacterium]
MKSLSLIFLFTYFAVNGFAQVEDIQYYFGIETSLMISPDRVTRVPAEVYESNFYQTEFSGLNINDVEQIENVQIGLFAGNFAINLPIEENVFENEILFSVGFQNGSHLTNNNLLKRITTTDTTYTQANININYKFRDVFGSMAYLLKSASMRRRYLKYVIGGGIKAARAYNRMDITEVLEGNKVGSYSLSSSSYSRLGLFIPFGTEWSGKIFSFKLLGAYNYDLGNRIEQANRFFSFNLSMQFTITYD